MHLLKAYQRLTDGVTMSDLQWRDHGLESRSGHYQLITTWMGDCLWAGKPSRYITKHQGQLSLSSLQG